MSTVDIKSFGELLRTAREAKKLSLPHIADALKLSLDKVESIENSDVEALPPATFTCGYLRLFAKLVDLDEGDIVQSYYDTIGRISESGGLSSTSDLPAQVSSQDLAMRIVSYSLVIAVIALFLFWIIGNKKDNATPVTPAAAEKNIGASEADTTLQSVSDEQSVESEKAPEINYFKNENTTPAETTEKKTVVKDVLDRSAEQIKVVEEKNAEQVKKDEILALAKEAKPVADSGNDVVQVSSTDDCWVEISDANGQLLFFSLLNKGKTVELQGQEPFKVFLGKATAISMLLNDIEYDISKHIRKNQVARFTMTMANALESQVDQASTENKPAAEEKTISEEL